MSSSADATAHFDPQSSAPSAFSRALLTFTSPSRAFTHMGKGGSWWLPYLLIVVVSLGFFSTVGAKVGWETVAHNNLANSPKQAAQIEKLPADQQAAQYATIAKITRISVYAGSTVGPLLFAAVAAGVLLATLNFGMGGSATFGALFAVYLFSALPQLLKSLLSILTLFLGLGGDSFQLSNALGSNPAYYLQGSATPHWLLSLLGWFDVFLIWQLVVLAIGCSVVAKVSRAKAYSVVFGWVLLMLVVGTSLSALT